MKAFASIAFAAVLGALAIPATSVMAPVEMTAAQACGTGGNASRSPHCNTTFLQTCASLGYRGPCGLGGNRAGSGYAYNGHGGYGGPVIVRRPVYRGGRPVAVPYYGAAGGREATFRGVPRAPKVAAPPPPPSPAQVNKIAKHTIERIPVDCDTADGFSRVAGSNRCAKITWVPGED